MANAPERCPDVPEPSRSLAMPEELLSARVVVISDFNCPYCFTLNEWLADLGLTDRMRWVGVEHKPHLPPGFDQPNHPDDLGTLRGEVSDVQRRAPDLGVTLPPGRVNSRQALLLQAALEDEDPVRAPLVRRRIFRRFWLQGRNIASRAELDDCLAGFAVAPQSELFLDADQVATITAWWAHTLDRIPCMLAPTGARYLGLQDRSEVEAFVLAALQEPPPAEGCR